MKIGIIVGRFQVPRLHEGHIKLIETAKKECDKVIIFVGSSIVRSEYNPLPYEVVKRNVLTACINKGSFFEQSSPHNCEVYKLDDMKKDKDWVINLFSLIDKFEGKKVFYGGRDSYLNTVKNDFPNVPTRLIDTKDFVIDIIDYKVISKTETSSISKGTNVMGSSSTEIRNLLKTSRATSPAEAYIKAEQDKFKVPYPCVDVILSRFTTKNGKDYTREFLLGYKNNQGWCLPGGFIDPEDNSAEEAALRELKEETNVSNVIHLEYFNSYKCNDWRYKRTIQPMTFVYGAIAECNIKEPIAGDDLDEVKWVSEDNVLDYFNLADSHYKYIQDYLEKYK